MRLLKYSRVTLVLLLLATQSFAQGNIGIIAGKLVDAKGGPVSYATVTLLKTDSSVVNGDLSKDDGTFKITAVPMGSFLVRVESMGMATRFIGVKVTADTPEQKLGRIKLSLAADRSLKGVEITADKPMMELKVEKKVFNVDQNTTTAGGSAADVLQNVPSVSVDVDGNVSLRGNSDVTILIDGKPSTLLGSDVATALQTLPAGSIESVEVINNPGAKYDAQGTGGIINIVTKKDQRFGINGNITLGAGTNSKWNGNGGLNIHKGKLSVFVNSSFRINNTYQDITTDRYNKNTLGVPDTSFHTYEHIPRQFDGSFNSVGATYDFDKNNSLTVTENVNFMDFGYQNYSSYAVFGTPNETGAPYIYENKYSTQTGGPMSLSSAVDFKHMFKKKDEELSVDATYANTSVHHNQDYTTYDSIPAVNTIYEVAPSVTNNSSVNLWVDYTDPLFTKNGKLGLGFKLQTYWFSSSNNPVFKPSDSVDNTLISDYNYTQQINAGYVNWSDQFGKFSYSAGLRYEEAIYSGNGQTPYDTSFHNSYADLFPSASVSYKLNDQESIYLQYTRRTSRPSFMQLLPYKNLSNPGTVSVGDPALVPEFLNNVEFSYNRVDKRGDNIILSAYYSYTQNLIETVTRSITAADSVLGLSQEIGQLLQQPVNIQSGTTYGVDGTAHVQIVKIWDATANVNVFENILNVGQVSPEEAQYLQNNSGVTWFGKINTNLKLPDNFSLQVNANYQSPKIITQGHQEQTYWLDAALKKNFLKNKLTIIANCSDIFKTHTFITVYNLPGYNETVDRVKETRIGTLTATYRFGKLAAPRHKEDLKPAPPTDEDRNKNLKQGGGDDSDQPGGSHGGNGSGGNGGGHN